jgi:hypothetical protein
MVTTTEDDGDLIALVKTGIRSSPTLAQEWQLLASYTFQPMDLATADQETRAHAVVGRVLRAS